VAAEGICLLLPGRIMGELVRPCLDELDGYTAFGAVGVVAGKGRKEEEERIK
jgi:hypothetical protein